MVQVLLAVWAAPPCDVRKLLNVEGLETHFQISAHHKTST